MNTEATQEVRITPRYMLLLIVSIPVFALIYYLVGTTFFASPLSLQEYVVFSTLVAIVVTGCYQLFFWVQRNNFQFKTRCFVTSWDAKIPFWPSWVWIYSFLYYIVIGFVVASIQSMAEGVYLIFGAIMLLLSQVAFFYLFPSTVPPEFRQYESNTWATKFLRFVQGKDNGRNCMPSMHCSVAMYVSLVLSPTIGNYAWTFVGLIAVSCLLVKQHQIADILPGIGLGYIVWYLAPTIA
jgi:hypothetical protein|tara:strand:- start:1490 stop:2203 length:714 start_codon:yes stop_codon:yes gene_type:complete